MAYPVSGRDRDFSNGFPPAYDDDFGNRVIQDAVVGLYGNPAGAVGKTLVALQVDGTGYQPTAAAAGDVKASGNVIADTGDVKATAGRLDAGLSVSGTTAPTTSVPQGFVAMEGAPIGWISVHMNLGSINNFRGYNVNSVTYNGAGNYTVVFNTVTTDPTHACMMPSADLDKNTIRCTPAAGGGGKQQVTFKLWDSTGTATDADWTLTVFAF